MEGRLGTIEKVLPTSGPQHPACTKRGPGYSPFLTLPLILYRPHSEGGGYSDILCTCRFSGLGWAVGVKKGPSSHHQGG